MGKFLVGLVVGLIVIPVCVYMYFSSGAAPVATSSAPMPFEKMLAGMALARAPAQRDAQGSSDSSGRSRVRCGRTSIQR